MRISQVSYEVCTHLNTNFIKGMAKRDDEFVIILDIDKIFSIEELNAITRGME